MLDFVIIVYLAGLLLTAHRRSIIVSVSAFRGAWISFTFVMFSEVIFTLIRAAVSGIRYGADKAMILTEVWSDGVSWLLMGIGMICLLNALIGDAVKPMETRAAEPGATDNPGDA